MTARLLRFSFLLLGALLFARAETAPALDREALLKTLVADLSAHYALADTLALDLVRPWSLPAEAAAAGATPAAVVVAEYPESLTPSLLLRVRYERDKTILKEETLILRANLWRDTWVAASPLKRGESVSPQGMELRRIDALRDREALPVTLAAADYVFARDVPAGRVLTWRDVMRRALVKRGEIVEVLATDGALVVTMKGLAMQDAAQGEPVRVRNLESKREFVAKVIAENRAEVRF